MKYPVSEEFIIEKYVASGGRIKRKHSRYFGFLIVWRGVKMCISNKKYRELVKVMIDQVEG